MGSEMCIRDRLFSIGDSLVDSDIDNIKLAASTIIASTIINLDETVRKG